MKNIKEVCIAVFLSVIIFIRFQIDDDKAQWIAIVNFAGLLIALIDLFYSVYHKNKDKNSWKIKVYTFVVIFVLIILMIPFALICTQYIPVTPKMNDFFTLMALLLTLSKQLWMDTIEQLYFL